MLARHKLPSPGGAPPSVLMATLMKATDSGAIVTALQTFKCPVPQLGCPCEGPIFRAVPQLVLLNEVDAQDKGFIQVRDGVEVMLYLFGANVSL